LNRGSSKLAISIPFVVDFLPFIHSVTSKQAQKWNLVHNKNRPQNLPFVTTRKKVQEGV
jgi:hypothetical protein